MNSCVSGLLQCFFMIRFCACVNTPNEESPTSAETPAPADLSQADPSQNMMQLLMLQSLLSGSGGNSSGLLMMMLLSGGNTGQNIGVSKNGINSLFGGLLNNGGPHNSGPSETASAQKGINIGNMLPLMLMSGGCGELNGILPLLLMQGSNGLDLNSMLPLVLMGGLGKNSKRAAESRSSSSHTSISKLLPLLMMGGAKSNTSSLSSMLPLLMMSGGGQSSDQIPLLLMSQLSGGNAQGASETSNGFDLMKYMLLNAVFTDNSISDDEKAKFAKDSASSSFNDLYERYNKKSENPIDLNQILMMTMMQGGGSNNMLPLLMMSPQLKKMFNPSKRGGKDASNGIFKGMDMKSMLPLMLLGGGGNQMLLPMLMMSGMNTQESKTSKCSKCEVTGQDLSDSDSDDFRSGYKRGMKA